jgi:hypothetical protein
MTTQRCEAVAPKLAVRRAKADYFVSLCPVCFRQKRQYLLNSSRSLVFFLFFVVL